MAVNFLLKVSLILSPVIFLTFIFIFKPDLWSPSKIQRSLCGMHHQEALTIPREFTTHPALEDLSHKGDEAWETELFTPHGGFLMVRRNETVKEKWGVSMFHGLHCLQLIRSSLQQAKEMGTPSMPGGHGNHHEQHSEHLDESHLQHCFSYITQVGTSSLLLQLTNRKTDCEYSDITIDSL